MQSNKIPEMALMNDNWQGYIEKWIYDVGITWMEKTVASPYWTGMTLFCIEVKRSEQTSRRQGCLNTQNFSCTGRIAFSGQIFSAPMDHASILEQLRQMEDKEPVVVPVDGPVLAARCRLSIASGLTDLNKLLKQATIRRPIVVEYIRLMKGKGHPDFRSTDLAEAKRRVKGLAPTDDPTIPECIQPTDLADVINEANGDEFLGTDKAATPAERVFSAANLEKSMARARPQVMLAQRDSDAKKDVRASRDNALEQFSEVQLCTGSSLLQQFTSDYPACVFHTSLPWCTGGPDFDARDGHNPRREKDPDAPHLRLPSFTSMLASRVEYNIRSDWDLLPGIWSLNFASQVNTMVSMSIKRCLRRGAAAVDGLSDTQISLATARIYEILWKGECEMHGTRSRINGDMSKLPFAVGLNDVEKGLLTNYQFMSSMLAGTRQIRRRIRYLLFSSIVVYGPPVFMTFTPSERHSGLAIRLYRGRRNDPAYASEGHDAKDFAEYIGYDVPSLCPKTSQGIDEEGEGVTIELPEYDLRRLITARVPLCCLQAFLVMARVLFPNLYGFRMCPRCPHCVKSRFPCIDRFGSNATPMGGAAGRADAMVGAVEAQQAEGVLHLHLFLFLQGASQFATLQELAEMFAKRALDIDAVKAFHSYVRCAEAPDVAKMEAERDAIERTWPAFAEDQSLCRIPEELWTMGRHAPAEHPWARPADDGAREQLPTAAAPASSGDIPHLVLERKKQEASTVAADDAKRQRRSHGASAEGGSTSIDLSDPIGAYCRSHATGGGGGGGQKLTAHSRRRRSMATM